MHESRLLNGAELGRRYSSILRRAQGRVLIVSAFLKVSALEKIAGDIPDGVAVSILTRWHKKDLLTGASDLEAFRFARQCGWRFYIDQQLHTKAVLVDRDFLFLGSSNLTNSGLHIFSAGNKELNVELVPTPEECDRILQYFSEAYEMNTPMYRAMSEDLESCGHVTETTNGDTLWHGDIVDCLEPVTNRIWVDECLKVPADEYLHGNSTDDWLHDQRLWEGQPSPIKFENLRVGKWLRETLLKASGAPVKFGQLSKEFHDALVNDPRPYRKDVKEYLSTLLSWAEYFGVIELVRFNHTKGVLLKI